MHFFQLNVEDVLSKTMDGNEILSFFKQNKFILPKHQQKVGNLMVDSALHEKNDHRLSLNDRLSMAKSISNYFQSNDPVRGKSSYLTYFFNNLVVL